MVEVTELWHRQDNNRIIRSFVGTVFIWLVQHRMDQNAHVIIVGIYFFFNQKKKKQKKKKQKKTKKKY